MLREEFTIGTGLKITETIFEVNLCWIDGQICLDRSQTDNFRLFLCQQTDKSQTSG